MTVKSVTVKQGEFGGAMTELRYNEYPVILIISVTIEKLRESSGLMKIN